ncbi:UDP-glycosyltransferase 83A1-like [Coffea arabica]|uniref:UDP-glycosyltransferase 83A1-like n=1 Tax=Coffea arabica TaxID=13443 RepID=A0ABM4W353_COFAR
MEREGELRGKQEKGFLGIAKEERERERERKGEGRKKGNQRKRGERGETWGRLDGLESWEDRNDAAKSMKAIFRVIPTKLEALIEKINQSESDKITCIIVDEFLGLALEVAKKIGVRVVSFSPVAAALYALKLNIPKLIDDGIIDSSGTIMKKQMVQLSPATLAMDSEHFAWASVGDATTRGIVFYAMAINNRTFKLADRIIGNSSNELEASVFTSFLEMLPIGPLLASNRLGKPVGS